MAQLRLSKWVLLETPNNCDHTPLVLNFNDNSNNKIEETMYCIYNSARLNPNVLSIFNTQLFFQQVFIERIQQRLQSSLGRSPWAHTGSPSRSFLVVRVPLSIDSVAPTNISGLTMLATECCKFWPHFLWDPAGTLKEQMFFFWSLKLKKLKTPLRTPKTETEAGAFHLEDEFTKGGNATPMPSPVLNSAH